MKSLLIKDTTTEERIAIVKNALNFGGADCEGIDMDDMYDDYIFGRKELADINREFSEKHAGCVRAEHLDVVDATDVDTNKISGLWFYGECHLLNHNPLIYFSNSQPSKPISRAFSVPNV